VSSAELDAFIARMPKIELHIHLEGSIKPRTLLALAERNGVEIPARDVAGVEQLFRYRDFGEFIAVFMNLARVLVHGEDFEQLAYELALDSAVQHVVYTEVMLSPMQHYSRGINVAEALEGMAAGFARAERETGIVARSVLDFGRQYGVQQAWEVLEIARGAARHGLVGWSIGGNEIGNPPEPFAEVFAAARAAGLHTMAHAGEVVGPESVWGAVDALGCERIGHGVRSAGDEPLLRHLRDRGVTLDVCPTSNLCTGAVPSLEAHPLRRLYDAGVAVTINTDDPSFFHTTLTDEYRLAARHFGFGADELCATVLAAARGAFLPPAEREALTERVSRELGALRAELGV
jgi:adenosine deaminase